MVVMYRTVRCSSGRGLVACVAVCLLLTVALWLRCDDSMTRLAASSSSSRHASLITATSVSKAADTDAANAADDVYHNTANDNNEEQDEVMEQTDNEDDNTETQHAADVLNSRGRADRKPRRRASSNYHSIECMINSEYSVSCQQDSNGEVYLPFKFIRKYFEVYGKMSDDNEVFYWQHSYSRVFIPESSYSPTDGFMSFEHYNVEIRDRVKCISAAEGVPLSNQWGQQGYFYPVQIAQYGLSHYSKYVKKSAKSSRQFVIEDAEDGTSSRWSVTGDATVHNVFDAEAQSRVIQFHTSELTASDSVVSLMFPDDTPAHFFLMLNIKFTTNGSLSVLIETSRHRTVRIHYACVDTAMSSVDGETVYGMGTDRTLWGRTLGRDITVDLQKGLGHKYGGRKKRVPSVLAERIVGLELRGAGRIDNVTVASNGHLLQFYYAADWLVKHQDDRGGWKIMVSRSVAEGQLSLEPGWYSAMAQGQAMSLLVRAHARSGRREYLDAAVRALALFDIPSADGGIVAKFMDRYVWYEEYPTIPPCFVLNGFMYALIGLYDVSATAPPGEGHSTAMRLYSSGVASLRGMLPLFDTGSGTVYDLRHLTLGGASPPNRARWDYHATHVNQLLLLSLLLQNGSIATDEPTATEFKAVANRWLGYMRGKLAPHN